MNSKNLKQGFTLLEMLLTVAIIAVLVAIAFPIYQGNLYDSKLACDCAMIKQGYDQACIKYMEGDYKIGSNNGVQYIGFLNNQGYVGQDLGRDENTNSRPFQNEDLYRFKVTPDSNSEAVKNLASTINYCKQYSKDVQPYMWKKDYVVQYIVLNDEVKTSIAPIATR